MTVHTFVVLAYNDSQFLEDCIQSLNRQTVPSTILLSTSTPSASIDRIAAKYALPVAINRGEKGIAADWNFGLSQAKTSFVTLAHQDDIYLPEFTQKTLQVAQQRSDNLITFCDYAEQRGEIVTSATTNLRIKRFLVKLAFWQDSYVRTPFLKRLLLSFGSPIPCPAVTYNINNLTNFQFSSSFSINMDWDAWIRIAARSGSIGHVPEVLQVHRIHTESETTSGIADNRRAKEDREMFKRLWPAPIAGALTRVYALSYRANKAD